jgi:CheY-like chemotaxis protein
MGGDIRIVKSEYGVGSHFKIILNQVIRSEEFISSKTVNLLQNFEYARGNSTGTIRAVDFVAIPDASVLVVDDVQINLDVIEGILEPYAMTVDKLLSGVEALKLMETGCEKYDILFIDHMMPVMDGIECVSKIRAIGSEYARTVPIIAFTANAVVGMEEEFLTAGFSGFISKPINTVKLDEIIHEFIDESKFPKPVSSESMIIRVISENKDKIDGVNFEEGLKKFNGNFDIYIRIFNSFINNIPEKLSQITSPDEDNIKNYAIVVHGIKGSCYGISANFAGDKAFELEKLAKENNLDEIKRLNSEFIKTIETLIDNLKEFVDSEKSVKEKATSPDTKILQTILTAAKHFNSEEMQKAITELNKFDYEIGGDIIKALKRNIDAFNYDATIEVIEGYLETNK